uniref:(Fe-S)-binding protein n=1 Tax=Ignisphaera aggregans TaxID=334771 RepID=A0A7C5YVC7_9CREN
MVPNMNSMKVLFWRGCTLRNILSETIAKIEYIFKKANIDVITLDIEGCCGYPLILAGYEKQFETCALNLLEKIKKIAT